MQRLTLSADVVKGPQLLAFQLRQTWPREGDPPTIEYTCWANVFTGDVPPDAPTVRADEALGVEFLGWSLRREGNPAKKWAWEWNAAFRVKRAKDHVDPVSMTIALNEEQSATVVFSNPEPVESSQP